MQNMNLCRKTCSLKPKSTPRKPWKKPTTLMRKWNKSLLQIKPL
ncbi:unnamed protein product [Dibothriocephalus latus]|uniref:Uncharacterized protein n=1 Tax=Dibothriocephalus latus TaxID=60516 RepID=A0A3P7MG30_DIBLA|nr:unnamed protein product [Dibothriocephalus latus]